MAFSASFASNAGAQQADNTPATDNNEIRRIMPLPDDTAPAAPVSGQSATTPAPTAVPVTNAPAPAQPLLPANATANAANVQSQMPPGPTATASPSPAAPPPPPGSALPVPNIINDDPAMTLNPNEALGAALGVGGNPNAAAQAKTPEEIEAEQRKEAFDKALQGLLPLKPDEIRQLLEHFDRTQESVELPVYPSPKPEIAVQTLSLDPGVPPVTVKVAYGNVTTLNFIDVSGAPWPIEDISWAGNFEVVNSQSQNGSHIVRITPQSEFATGNMSVRLLTLKTPVILSLETSRDIVHYRFDAVIPEYGPMAETPLIDKGITVEAGDESIASVLQGVAPKSAVKLAVSGTDGRTSAYRLNGLTYVRTPLTLLSPSWTSSVASADGMHVYAIKSAPVLLLSDKGQMVHAHLSDREDLLEDISHE